MSLVLNVEILGEFKKLTQATKGAETSLSKLSKTTTSISRTMTSALAAVGVGFSLNAVINGVKGAVTAASDLEQQFGGVESVFKELAPEIQTFARNLAPIGLSASDAARSMTLLGSQLKGYGLPVREAADKTKELTQLAADLAATFGGTTADAVSSISALFRGEFDPIEKYGVAIKKSDVNARLAAEGLKGLEGEALKQAEAQAALALLFEKTADAQGQAARESNTYASQSAYLNAEFENMKAAVGEALLPILVDLFSEIRDNIPAIKEFVAGFIDVVKWVASATLEIIKHKDVIFPIAGIVLGIVTAVKAYAVAQGLLNLALANPYLLGATVVLGGIAAGMIAVYNNTKSATSAIEEFNRQQSLKNTVTTKPFVTPEQINADLYSGILSPPKATTPAVPKSTKQTPLKGGTSGKTTGGTTNVTVNVNKSSASANEIVKVINDKIKATGGKVFLQ